MKRSAPTNAQPAPKRTRRRTKSTPEKRQSAAKRVQQHRSTTAGTAQADIARENDRLRKQQSRASKENTPPPSQQASALSGEAIPAVRTVHRQPMTAVPAAASGQRHEQPLAAMRTPASRRSDAPLPAAMTDSSAMPPTAPRRTTARVVPPSTGNDTASVAQDPSAKVQFWVFRPRRIGSGARKGAALGIPPPADRVGGTHQSLGLDNEKALDAVLTRYTEQQLSWWQMMILRKQSTVCLQQ
jgi:hypothetical protein